MQVGTWWGVGNCCCAYHKPTRAALQTRIPLAPCLSRALFPNSSRNNIVSPNPVATILAVQRRGALGLGYHQRRIDAHATRHERCVDFKHMFSGRAMVVKTVFVVASISGPGLVRLAADCNHANLSIHNRRPLGRGPRQGGFNQPLPG